LSQAGYNIRKHKIAIMSAYNKLYDRTPPSPNCYYLRDCRGFVRLATSIVLQIWYR
jgi:hypothetical protein